MKTIHPFIRGLLLLSLLLAYVNVALVSLPLADFYSRFLELSLYTTIVLTVLGTFYMLHFLLEFGEAQHYDLTNSFFLFIPVFNVAGLIWFFYLFIANIS